MKTLKVVSTFLLTVFLLSPAFAQDEGLAKEITPEIALQAIEIMENDPLGKDFEGAASIVTVFAESSENVTVLADAKLLPWINKNYSEKVTYLLAAFIAGNIKPQIVSGVNKDSPYEGVLLIIKVYKAWRKEGLIEEIPELDEWSTFNEKQLRALTDNKP